MIAARASDASALPPKCGTTAQPGSLRDFGPGRRPVEIVIGSYLLLGALLLLTFGHHVDGWPWLVLLNCVCGGGLVALAHVRTIPWAPLALLRRLLPLATGPLLYMEVAALNDIFFADRYFDDRVIAWELALFGRNLAVDLRAMLPWRPLSEYLHLAYLSYYAVSLVLWLSLVSQRRWRALESYLTVLGLVFTSCELWFIAFPVAGPFHHLTPPAPESLGAWLPPLVHTVVQAGSSVGTAFPSSHCAVSGIVLVMALRTDRVASMILLCIVPALAVGAVYGGFHYAVDAVAGWAWCLLLLRPGLWIHERLSSG